MCGGSSFLFILDLLVDNIRTSHVVQVSLFLSLMCCSLHDGTIFIGSSYLVMVFLFT